MSIGKKELKCLVWIYIKIKKVSNALYVGNINKNI